jgi:hypothetical protein
MPARVALLLGEIHSILLPRLRMLVGAIDGN